MQDYRMKHIIEDEIERDSRVPASHIGVTVTDRVVSVFGHVATATEKMATIDAVRRVPGVQAIADEIEIRSQDGAQDADDEIALKAISVLKAARGVPDRKMSIRVQHGHVEIDGQVKTLRQKLIATDSVAQIPGVTQVSNHCLVQRPLIQPDLFRARLADALHKHADREIGHIKFKIRNRKVTLSGDVESQAEIDTVIQAALSERGVSEVENRLRLRYAGPRG